MRQKPASQVSGRLIDIRVRTSLKARRHEIGLSQQELAARVGVSRQTINSIERERTSISLALAFIIAKECGAPLGTLFDYEFVG